MNKNFNKLTPAETERLAILAEECAEVIQVVSKILRHGYADAAPDVPVHTENRVHLEKEMGDVRYAMIAMCEAGDTSKENIHAYADDKRERIKQWLHHS